MKTKLIALSLVSMTAATIAFYPMAKTIIPELHSIKPAQVNTTPIPTVASNFTLAPVNHATTNERPKIEVVFVLDTTGSMGGLIQAAKDKIWSIATTMANVQPAPEIKIGLVAYRDRGDAYVTQVFDLSTDLDSMFATLMDFSANGGGDGPESVNKALYDAVNAISWSQNQDSYKAVFLVGDAPPHMDYQDEVQFPLTLANAKTKGIVVNTIQCGEDNFTKTQWQQMAQLADGRYFQVGQAGSAVAIETPFDSKIASLSKALDDTRLYYGSDKEKEKQQSKVDATKKLHDESSVATRARRATFNASKSGELNFLGEGELVDDIASGKADLSSIDTDYLPAPMQAMTPAAQAVMIQEKARQRQELKAEIATLAHERQSYLKEKAATMDGVEESLDYKIFGALRDQAEKKGIVYKESNPAL